MGRALPKQTLPNQAKSTAGNTTFRPLPNIGHMHAPGFTTARPNSGTGWVRAFRGCRAHFCCTFGGADEQVVPQWFPQVVAFSIARHIAQAQDVGSMVRVPVTRNEVVVIQGVDQQCIHSAPVVIVSPIAQVRGVPSTGTVISVPFASAGLFLPLDVWQDVARHTATIGNVPTSAATQEPEFAQFR